MTAKSRPSPEEQRKRDERYRTFVEHSTEGIWCIEVERPIHVELPEDEQIRQMYRYACLAEANDAMARMYGMKSAEEIRGARLGDLLVETDPHNVAFLKAFIRSGYRLRDAESHELDRAGRPRYFLNNFIGVVEDGRLLRAWGVKRDVTEARRMQEDLRQSEERARQLVDLLPDAVFIHTEARFVYANNAAVRMLGAASAADLVGRPVLDIVHPDFVDLVKQRIRSLHEGKQVTPLSQMKVVRLDGASVDAEITGCRFAYEGKPSILVVMRDVTARLNLEVQLRQAQKMEAVGRLAGGVAHDFNNLLTVITGRCDLLLRGVNGNQELREELEEIRRAGERAASLTRQLLAFSRKQVLQPKVIDLNSVVEGMNKMLRRLIGEDIELVCVLAPDLGHVRADPGQIEQVLMNLAVNARDAMPGGGRLTIETSNAPPDPARPPDDDSFDGGDSVMITVTDTGIGMDAHVQSHLFEPFFTLKRQGQGTGLGLPTVYGIVKQSGGHVWVDSTPGKGTTFRVCLPAVAEALDLSGTDPAVVRPVRGTETILVVEDEPVVSDLACDILKTHGYNVLKARTCGEARRVCEEHDGPIHLLLADVVMPTMNGPELSRSLAAVRSGLKVLYMSGYALEAIVHRGVLQPGIAFLQKPFAPDALARRVREVLDT